MKRAMETFLSILAIESAHRGWGYDAWRLSRWVRYDVGPLRQESRWRWAGDGSCISTRCAGL